MIHFEINLTVDEQQNAERTLMQYLQRCHLPDLMPLLLGKGKEKALPRFLQKLRPVISDGILRIGGRLNEACVDFDRKHPIIFPQFSHFTELVITERHEAVGHSGTSFTWASLCSRYWVIRGGAAVRRTIGEFVLCEKGMLG